MKRTEGVIFVLTLGAISAVAAMAIDIVIPVQPTIADAYALPISAGASLVSTFLLGYGIGQAFWGPVSDRYGRTKTLAVALSGFVLASLLCVLTDDFEIMLLARTLQGFMSGATPVISRAISRDLGGGKSTAILISTLTLVQGLAPLLAPLIGSGLLALFNWRATLWFLVLFGIIFLIACCLFIPETLESKDRRSITAKIVFDDVNFLLNSWEFIFGTVVTSSMLSGYVTVLAVGAAVTQERYGVSGEVFGPLFAIAGIGFIVGSAVSRQANKRYSAYQVLLFGAIICGISSTLLLLSLSNQPGLLVFWSLVTIFIFSFGIIYPNGITIGLKPAGKRAGTGSSLMGVIQTTCGVIGAELAASSLFANSYEGFCWMMGGAGIFCVLFSLITLPVYNMKIRSNRYEQRR